MSRSAPGWESPDTLRLRAKWYRDYAAVCGGDNAWCIRLADHFDELAREIEAKLEAPKPSR